MVDAQTRGSLAYDPGGSDPSSGTVLIPWPTRVTVRSALAAAARRTAHPRRPRSAGAADVLTPEVVAFLTDLEHEFGGRRRELLARRRDRLARPAHGRAAGLPARDRVDPRGGLAGRAVPGRDRRPARRDHRPGRPQDGHQRPQLRREGLHGRLRGRQLADLGQLHRGPAQPHRRARPHDRARRGREAVQAERRGGDAVRAPARLAPGRAALRGRRSADVRRRSSTSASTSTATTRAAGTTSTCRSSSRTSRRGSGTTSSASRRTGWACRAGRSRRRC